MFHGDTRDFVTEVPNKRCRGGVDSKIGLDLLGKKWEMVVNGDKNALEFFWLIWLLNQNKNETEKTFWHKNIMSEDSDVLVLDCFLDNCCPFPAAWTLLY